MTDHTKALEPGLPLSDDEIVKVLHSLGVDTYPSIYGFEALQVSATSVPTIRKIVESCIAAIEADRKREGETNAGTQSAMQAIALGIVAGINDSKRQDEPAAAGLSDDQFQDVFIDAAIDANLPPAFMLTYAKRLDDFARAIAARLRLPEGYVAVPHYRGYANLGTGNYIINHSAKGAPAELVISVATEAQKDGREVGDEQDNPPDEIIYPEEMCVRIEFQNEAGLIALERQLAYLREVHFPIAAAPTEGQDKPNQQEE